MGITITPAALYQTTLEIEGAKELEAKLRMMGPAIARNLGTRGLRALARPIVLDAKARVRRRSGALRKSITAVVANKGANAGERRVYIGFKKGQPGIPSRRAHLEEYGTIHQASHPFIRPAIQAMAAPGFQEMTATIAKGIAAQDWKNAIADLDGDEIDIGD
jgi:HK97 gp10 family phage protein